MHRVYLKALRHRNLLYKPHNFTSTLRQALPGKGQWQCPLAELMTFPNQFQTCVE